MQARNSNEHAARLRELSQETNRQRWVRDADGLAKNVCVVTEKALLLEMGRAIDSGCAVQSTARRARTAAAEQSGTSREREGMR